MTRHIENWDWSLLLRVPERVARWYRLRYWQRVVRIRTLQTERLAARKMLDADGAVAMGPLLPPEEPAAEVASISPQSNSSPIATLNLQIDPDLNRDGRISANDVLVLINRLNQPEPNVDSYYVDYDVDGDGAITFDDAGLMVMAVEQSYASGGSNHQLSGNAQTFDAAADDDLAASQSQEELSEGTPAQGCKGIAGC